MIFFGIQYDAANLTISSYFQRLDRAWYDMDSGQDETHNPFSNVSDEYVAQKEEAIAKKQFKRISAQQRQINKVCYPKNPFLTSELIKTNFTRKEIMFGQGGVRTCDLWLTGFNTVSNELRGNVGRVCDISESFRNKVIS